MAEEKKDSLYKKILETRAKMGGSSEKFKSKYPEVGKWFYAPVDHATREKMLESAIADQKFQDELRKWFAFRDYDFSQHTAPAAESKLSYDDVPMAEVNVWYDKARKTLDPNNKLRNTELYDLKDANNTFEQIEGMPEYGTRNDWFGKLLDSLGYPDTAEGYEQLTQDMQTVFNRKKVADKAKKYGAPVEFVMGNSMGRMEEGYKPTAGDVVSDATANASWMMPTGIYLKGLQGMGLAPKLAFTEKASELARMAGVERMLKNFADADKLDKLAKGVGKFDSLGKRTLAAVEENAVAPVVSELAKLTMGSGDYSPGDAALGAMTGNLVNMTHPLRFALGRSSGLLGSLFADGQKIGAGEIMAAMDKGAKAFGEGLPWLEAYVDNRLGNSEYAEYLKRPARRIGRMFGIDFSKKDDEQQ